MWLLYLEERGEINVFGFLQTQSNEGDVGCFPESTKRKNTQSVFLPDNEKKRIFFPRELKHVNSKPYVFIFGQERHLKVRFNIFNISNKSLPLTKE